MNKFKVHKEELEKETKYTYDESSELKPKHAWIIIIRFSILKKLSVDIREAYQIHVRSHFSLLCKKFESTIKIIIGTTWNNDFGNIDCSRSEPQVCVQIVEEINLQVVSFYTLKGYLHIENMRNTK